MPCWSKYILFSMLILSAFRLVFFLVHIDRRIPAAAYAKSFLHGLRFDASMLCIILAPVWLLSIIAAFPYWPAASIHFMVQAIKIYSVLSLLCVTTFALIDLGFYHEFKSRLNYLFFEYLTDLDMAIKSILTQWPFLVLLLLLPVCLLGEAYFAIKILTPLWITTSTSLLTWGLYSMISLIGITIVIRGGAQRKPLEFIDSCRTGHHFSNQLILNPIASLLYSIKQRRTEKVSCRLSAISSPLQQCEDSARILLQEQNAQYIDHNRPILRVSSSPKPEKNYNIVVIFMESFAASHTGVLGSDLNLTPEFDRLSKEGVLFSNLFSKGSRTNRALSGTLLSFPALPRLIAITKDHSKQQPFSCLAQILKQRDYQSHFLIGGNLAYDNMQGFFAPQGFDYFHSEPDFAKNTWRGHWGVDDHQLFNKAIGIIQRQTSPFLLSILTSTNHPPYTFPSCHNIPRFEPKHPAAMQYNAFRYSDWALGQFMQQLKKTDQYDKTIFVILGDHGFPTSGRQKTISLSLDTYHTAGLIIAPELTPGINARIAGQIDIVPSVLALLGGQWRHQSWGKNLFTEPSPLDFATFAPSGLNHQMGIVTPTSYIIHDFIGQNEYYRHNGHAIENNLRKIKQLDPALQATEERILELTKLASHAIDKKLCGIEA